MSIFKEDFNVAAEIEKARTLPIKAFRSRDFLQQELETVFRKSWVCLPKVLLRKPLSSSSEAFQKTFLECLNLRGNAVRYRCIELNLKTYRCEEWQDFIFVSGD